MTKQQFDSFADFYPFYLSQHTNRTSKRLHFIGLILSSVFLLIVLITASWFYLPITLILGYGFSWIGHFFFEKNKPATFDYPLFSLLGDFTMVKDIISGQVEF